MEGFANPVNSWRKVLFVRLQTRNKLETYPFHDIYESTNKIFQENIRLHFLQTDFKIQLNSLQFDVGSSLSLNSSVQDTNELLMKIKGKITSIQDLWKESDSTPTNTASSLKLFDQKKIIMNQSEELKILKNELSKTVNENCTLSETITKEKLNNAELTKQIEVLAESNRTEKEGVNKAITQLQQENEALIKQLLAFKEKEAERLNNLNDTVVNNESNS